jgi:hypothetical protein
LGCFGINQRCAAFISSAWIIVGSATIDSDAVAAMPTKKLHFVMLYDKYNAIADYFCPLHFGGSTRTMKIN